MLYITLIKQTFEGWEGCELHSISYTSDEENNADNLSWMNELAKGQNLEGYYDQVIAFKSSFHSPKKEIGAWNPDQEYDDWGWWLARKDNGKWDLLTWGY